MVPRGGVRGGVINGWIQSRRRRQRGRRLIGGHDGGVVKGGGVLMMMVAVVIAIARALSIVKVGVKVGALSKEEYCTTNFKSFGINRFRIPVVCEVG